MLRNVAKTLVLLTLAVVCPLSSAQTHPIARLTVSGTEHRAICWQRLGWPKSHCVVQRIYRDT
jgi:hypothetical protein